MRFSKKIQRVGNSFGMIFDKKILDVMKVNKDDWLEVEIKRIRKIGK